VSTAARQVAFRTQSNGTSRLYLRRADQFESVPIPGSDGAHSPFFSPNGEWIGFLLEGNLYKASVAGGAPIFITSAPSLSPTSPGVTWGTDGTIVFAAGAAGLMRVADTGGTAEVLTSPDASRGEVTHIAPRFVPGGREVLFSIRTTAGQWRVGVLSLQSRKWDWLPPLGQIAGATYVADTRHLVYAQQRKLFAIPVDLAARTFTGPQVALPENVYMHVVGGSMVAQFAVSDTGVLAFMAGDPENQMLVRVSPARSEQRITEEPHGFRYPRLSPANDQITVTIEDERSDVALIDVSRGTLRKLTKNGSATTPTFTRDGLKVVFSWIRPDADSYDIYSVPIADNDAPPEPVLVGRPGSQFVSGWSQTDDVFAFYELTNQTSRDIWTWSTKTRTATKVAATTLNETSAIFSRDGTWLAFVSNDVASRQSRVYVLRYGASGQPLAVSPLGGTEPVWSPTADRLYYRLGNKILAVAFNPASGTAVGEPAAIIEGPYLPAPSESGRPNYDVAKDGSLVMVRSVDRSSTHLHVVQRWFEELRATKTR
jgi:Tol biopolymer transport system component